MKKSRFTEEQIIGIVKQREAGKDGGPCREHRISAATFYGGKSKYGGMERGTATATDGRQQLAIEGTGCRPKPGPRSVEVGHSKKRLELAGLREDVAFAHAEHGVSERRACKLLGVDRASHRYEILGQNPQ